MSDKPFTVSRHTMTDFEVELYHLEQYATTAYILSDVLQDILNSEVVTQFEGETDNGHKINLYNVFLALRDESDRIIHSCALLQNVFDCMYSQNEEYTKYIQDKNLEVPRPAWLD